MPIYEYICTECNGRFAKLVQGYSDPANLACPRCQSTAVKRAISRVAQLRSEEAKLDAMADPAMFSGLDENDPRSVARWAKKMGKELGDEMGDDWDSMVDQMIEEEMQGESGEGSGTRKQGDDLGWA